MSETRQLNTLLKLRRLGELKQQKIVNDSLGSYRRQQSMSQQLAQYREDYRLVNHSIIGRDFDANQKINKPMPDNDAGCQLQRLQNATQFMLKLNRAEKIQTESEAKSQQLLQAAKENLQEEMATCRALDTLIENRVRLINIAVQKHDEFEAQDIWMTSHLR